MAIVGMVAMLCHGCATALHTVGLVCVRGAGTTRLQGVRQMVAFSRARSGAADVCSLVHRCCIRRISDVIIVNIHSIYCFVEKEIKRNRERDR